MGKVCFYSSRSLQNKLTDVKGRPWVELPLPLAPETWGHVLTSRGCPHPEACTGVGPFIFHYGELLMTISYQVQMALGTNR